MYLNSLYLYAFRNYPEQAVKFSQHKTIILGNNAQGKSNLLEAVELLATLKSHRVSRDRDLVFTGAESAQILAEVNRNYSQVELGLVLRVSGRKTVLLNRESLPRHLDFLGFLNSVQFSSLDLDLVRGAPEARRDWVDTLLTQLEPLYAYILQQYNQILRQRNALLKTLRKKELNSQDINPELNQLKIWDLQLAEMGSRVTRRRARVLRRLTPIAQVWHSNISARAEELDIKYTPNVPWEKDEPQAVQQAFLEKIDERQIPERQLGTSVVGPHRDEIEFMINETPAKAYGSQGQQRTLVLALKLAELKLIEEVVGEPPLLLLDDVLAELDPTRQNQLLEAIQERFQTLITTTHLSSFAGGWLKDSQILRVEQGKIFS
jgi:DNA replication and repair protein RecF